MPTDKEKIKKQTRGLHPNKGQGVPNAGRKKGSTGVATDIKRCIRALQKDGKLPRHEDGSEMYPRAMRLVAIAMSAESMDKDKIKAIEIMFDRVEGKPTQKIEQKTENITPTKIELVAPCDDNNTDTANA